MTFVEMINLALFQASRGLTPAQADLLMDADAIAESLVPQVFQEVGQACASDPRKRSLLRRTKTVSFTNGAGTLTSDVLTQCADDSYLYDPSDPTIIYSHVREFADFVGYLDTRLNYYNIESGVTIRVIEDGDEYDSLAGATKSLSYSTPCVPAIPTSATANVDVADEIASDLVSALAEAIKGMPIQEASEAVSAA